MQRNWVLPAALFLAFLPYLFGLGSIGLFESEETRYAQIAREMLVGGDWLVPRLGGLPHLEKPPLAVWATALSFRFFGESEFAARLVPLLAALVTLFFTWKVGRLLGGPRVGALAAGVLLASPLFFGMARILSTDTLFAAGTTGALYFLLAAQGSPALGHRLGLGVALAAALLTKGPVALLLFSLSAVALVWSKRSLAAIRPIGHPLAWGSFFLLGLPWFFSVQERYPGFFDFFLLRQHAARFLGTDPSDKDLHHEPPWYFLPVLAVGFLPWALLLPSAFRNAWRSWKPGARAAELRALWLWAALCFLFFSAGAGKRVPYVLPLWPALAVGIAAFWAGRENEEPSWFRRASLFPAALIVVAGLFVSAAFVLKQREPRLSLKAIGEKAAEIVPPEGTLLVFPRFYPGASYYGRRKVEVLGSLHELKYGLKFEPGKLSPLASDRRFGELRREPGRLFLLGSRRHVLANLPRWDPQGKLMVVAEDERWILLRN